MNAAPIQRIEVTDPRVWRSYAQAMPEPHILQSWAWGLSKRQTGWDARRLAWGERGVAPGGGDSIAAWAVASLLVRRVQARLPVAVAYVPKGPLLDWSDEALATAVLRDIESAARRAGAIFVKIDPDVRSGPARGRCGGGVAAAPRLAPVVRADPVSQHDGVGPYAG